MERSISFRFFKITRHNNKIPKFVDALAAIDSIAKRSDREKELAPDFVVRLEEFEKDGPNAVMGEIIRVQKTNMPSEVHANGRGPLTIANPLGHGVTFRFNDATSVLCIQHEPRVASCGRFADYISMCLPGAIYEIRPLVKPKAWERFNKGAVKKIAIKIAQPEHLGALAGPNDSAASGFRNMAEAYDAPVITIELSMGRKKGRLSEKVKSLAKAISDAASKPQGADLRSMHAVTYMDDAREEVDLIEERLKIRESLPLDDRDPAKNYAIKKTFIRKIMNDQGV